jgi:hypothetical protein
VRALTAALFVLAMGARVATADGFAIPDDMLDRVEADGIAQYAHVAPIAGDDSALPHSRRGDCASGLANDPYWQAWCTHDGNRRAIATALAELYRGELVAAVRADLVGLLANEYNGGDALVWLHDHVTQIDDALLDQLGGAFAVRDQWADSADVLGAATAPSCARAAALELARHHGASVPPVASCPQVEAERCLDALRDARDSLGMLVAADACLGYVRGSGGQWLVGRLGGDQRFRPASDDPVRSAEVTTIVMWSNWYPPAYVHDVDSTLAELAHALDSAGCNPRVEAIVRSTTQTLEPIVGARGGDLSRLHALASTRCASR